MKRLFLIGIITVAAFLGGCDNRSDVLTSISASPAIAFLQDKQFVTGVTDSIKMSDSTNYYPLVLSVGSGTSQVNSLQYQVSGENGKFVFNSQNFTAGKLPTEYPIMNLNYFPDSLGTSKILFTATNRFGKICSATATICYFYNLPPKAVLNASIDTTAAYAYTIDASKSYDQDAKYGGYIKCYSYTLNNQVITTARPGIHYAFPRPGNYIVNLTVTDNNNATSQATDTLTVQ